LFRQKSNGPQSFASISNASAAAKSFEAVPEEAADV
jgi:hypothetical protein